MTGKFPEFYVSRVSTHSQETVYYKVTGKDPDGNVFWRREDDDRSRETTFYDLLMEEKNGFCVTRIEKSETPWAE